MKLIYSLVFAACLLVSCGTDSAEQIASASVNNPVMKVTYPETKTVDQTDDYFGTSVEDPYRWLEIDTASDTKAWVTEQNKVTFDYLSKIPYRDAIKDRYRDLFNFPKIGAPIKAGAYYFFYKNDGLQNQSVLYRQKGLDGEPEEFLNPNTMSDEGIVSVNIAGFSEDDKYLAYSVSEGGSDWSEIHVKEVATGNKLPDVLKWVKFSGASWKGDGFYYSRMPAPAEGTELSAANDFHSVYFHKLGDDQSKDKVVYMNEKEPKLYHFVYMTEDSKYLILNASTGTDGFELYFKDLDTEGSDFQPLFTGFDHKNTVIDHVDGKFLMRTDVDAPKYRLVEVDVNNVDPANWKDIIPEKENLLQGVSTGGGKLFADYLVDATTRIFQYDYDGSNEKAIKLPSIGSAGGFGGKKEDKILFYSFTSFTYPSIIFKYDVETGQSSQFHKTELKFNPDDFETKQVFFESKDGTKVPMFLVYKKGLQLDGTNPTELYAYGGFNISLSPSFSTSRMILLENGGVYALANLRGGGEYGEEWHKAGMLMQKQNVFDDFIAAAEFLIKEGYTSSEKLAISGGSNGGLLVGAVMTQRPELFAVAFPAVGVMDMLRYHKFTVGWGWVPEYGSSEESKEMFEYLKGYSPIHNLKKGVVYPSTMVTTADHDDRVVPAHSFKFAATLQDAHAGDNPVLIRVAVDAGHGAGKPTEKVIEEQADKWSFFFYNTNSPVRYLEN